MRFLSIPRRVVEFENMDTTEVQAFRISQCCVTIGEYLNFQHKTGYTTMAEREGRKSFCDNELINDFDEPEKRLQTAYCISYSDAFAFTEWHRSRLPTEAEWLAASIVDANVYGDRRECPLCNVDGRLDLSLLREEIALSAGFELTCSREGDSIVIRSGPRYFRDFDWREAICDHRQLVETNEVDLMVSFRVCCDES